MTNVHIVAIDLAKRSFQVCATALGGAVLFNRSVSRAKLEAVIRERPPCVVAMEACATSHFWGRFAQGLGHEVRLIPPIREAIRQTPEERRGRCSGHCRSSLMPKPALRGREERRAPGSCRRFPDASALCRSAYAVDQRLARSLGRVRAGRSPRPCKSEIRCRLDRRRRDRSSQFGARRRPSLSGSDRAADAED